jgi:glutamate N-acetyltransferase/amino-acid N-acetyltransferase
MAELQASVTLPRGFRAAAGRCGIKASGKPDLALIVSDQPARIAAVFTTNAVQGEPVIVGRQHVARGLGRAIVCNAGVANVATGKAGRQHAIDMCRTFARAIDCDPHAVLPASTGVIGQPLPIKKILSGIETLAGQLDRGPKVDQAVAEAILTTDLQAKQAHQRLRLGRTTAHLGAVAKGSGMIAPNMATMLVFITTDAAISRPLLNSALRQAVNADASFNRITVDSDTSTSDTVAILANGQAGNPLIRRKDSSDYRRFVRALTDLSCDLAYQIIADGEGATRVIRVEVTGAGSADDAHRAARAVADSPLVKTAVHGADPNWGRLAMAVGKAPAKVDPQRLTIRIGRVKVFERGRPARFDVETASAQMQVDPVLLRIDLGLGTGRCAVLTCDLSRQYIAINADYHT